MTKHDILKSPPFGLFERLLFFAIPLVGILVPACFNLFQHNAAALQTALYSYSVLVSFIIGTGCRKMFLYLRLPVTETPAYKQFLIRYSLFTVVYAFGVAYLSFSFLNSFFAIRPAIVAVSGMVALLALLVSAAYEIFLLNEEKNRQYRQHAHLKKVTALTELRSVQSRIEPHFLFNALSVLQNLITEDRDLANRFNLRLSDVCLQVTTAADKNLVSLQDDLNMMYKYYDLISMRFPEATHLTLTMHHFNPAAVIPPLTLQLLLENAVKHNAFSPRHPLRIEIGISSDHICFSNTKNPVSVHGTRTKNGLRILSQRFVLLFEKNIEVWTNDNRFTVMLPLKTACA